MRTYFSGKQSLTLGPTRGALLSLKDEIKKLISQFRTVTECESLETLPIHVVL